MEVLGADNVDEPGGYVGDIGDDDDGDEIKDGGGWAGVKKAEPAEQILLVKRKGNLAGQNLQPFREGRLQERSACIACAAERPGKAWPRLFTWVSSRVM